MEERKVRGKKSKAQKINEDTLIFKIYTDIYLHSCKTMMNRKLGIL